MPAKKKPGSVTEESVFTTENIQEFISEWLTKMLPGLIEKAVAPLIKSLETYRKEKAELQKRVEYLEDSLVSDQIEVSGVPVAEEENTNKIAYQVLRGLKLDETNIKNGVINSYRLPKSKTSNSSIPPKIVVKLASPHIRRLAYSNRIRHQFTSKDLGFDCDRRIFVNERLRPSLRPVFHDLIELKRKKTITSVWTHNQTILVKVSKEDKPEVVNNLETFMQTLN